MFERFTDRARRVVVLAQEEARILNHNHIGTEHILLGLISESDGIAGQVLLSHGLSLESVRSEVEKEVGSGKSSPSGHIPFTPRAKKALELSLSESLRLRHNYIGTEHVLLGLIRQHEGFALQVLTKLDIGLSRLRRDVMQVVGGTSGVYGRSPAVEKAAGTARRLAGIDLMGSHHYLLALASDETSMAAKALSSLGVSRQQIEEELARIDRAGTSDEAPEEAGARRIRLVVEDDRLRLDVDDPQLVAMLKPLVEGGQIGPVIRGDDPRALGPFPQLWSALRDAVHQLALRTVAEPDEGEGAAETESTDE